MLLGHLSRSGLHATSRAPHARSQMCVHAPRWIRRSSGPKGPVTQQMLVIVPPHPLVSHWLAVMRNATTPSPMFRNACSELGRLLVYEAMREFLPTVEGVVDTPLGPADVKVVDPSKPIKVVPILRAGIVMLEQAQQVLPSQEVYHVGYVRDEQTLQATPYLNKLPARFAEDDLILITDPMLATGGTMLQVVDDIVARGAKPENIRIVAVVVAPPAMVKLSEKYKGIRVFTSMIDPEVNDKGLIVPGLGDAGDRAFGLA
ncbi:uracil phosphoribosyltransferase [Dunaliella salina]|uniref:uracil phosphoribosyltransferase n=1 Tax=Dunaliella salina TaxID=3046 RepID=A0ABQ7H6A3_DUNSA|nr:uracil phosphoribosyltransferase [Dunaliella salina]|eukprot:KAF5842384.1 uracil phosphoribosyltransferase [Dunaliella salina]